LGRLWVDFGEVFEDSGEVFADSGEVFADSGEVLDSFLKKITSDAGRLTLFGYSLRS